MLRFSSMVIRKRIALLFLVSLVGAVILTGRLLYLQVVQNQRYLSLALEQRLRPVPVEAGRGTIYDRNMEELAVSVSSQAVYAVPVEVKDRLGTARFLVEMLGVDYEKTLQKLSNIRHAQEWIKLDIDPEVAKRVRKAAIPGVGVVERPVRYYPNGSMAAQILGFSGSDSQGLEGIEAYYDSVLKGQRGKVMRERDARGRLIPNGVEDRVAPQNGNSIVLTVDAVIQSIAERELEKAVKETMSDFGMFLMVQPKTGAILATTTYPSFDPNDYGGFDPALWRNRALTDQFEPGSTFKVVTGSSALDAGVATLSSVYVDPVILRRWGGKVSCWRPQGHGRETFVEATENSCNPIFAILAADELGRERFHKYVTAFGFGKPLGVDFPGEASGSVASEKAIPLRWANIGFGQGISVTPLQLVMAAATIANDGVLMKPHFLKEVRDDADEIVDAYEPTAMRRVLSSQAAADFLSTMRSVVKNGSGSLAQVPGYRVAGKTGTAQVPEGGRYGDKRLASFLGVAPVDDPQIVGAVMLYNLKVYPKYGGVQAAPVFARIAQQVLEYMGVPRKAGEEQGGNEESFVEVPNVRNHALEEAEELLLARRLNIVFDGVGDYIIDQVPAPGARVEPGTQVILSFYDDEPNQ